MSGKEFSNGPRSLGAKPKVRRPEQNQNDNDVPRNGRSSKAGSSRLSHLPYYRAYVLEDTKQSNNFRYIRTNHGQLCGISSDPKQYEAWVKNSFIRDIVIVIVMGEGIYSLPDCHFAIRGSLVGGEFEILPRFVACPMSFDFRQDLSEVKSNDSKQRTIRQKDNTSKLKYRVSSITRITQERKNLNVHDSMVTALQGISFTKRYKINMD